jgi:hypothetical protein
MGDAGFSCICSGEHEGPPTNTACALSARALITSIPRRKPLSIMTVSSPALSKIPVNVCIGDTARSSRRPPWFDRMIPSAPQSRAKAASAGERMPLTTSGPFQSCRISRM